MLSRLWREPQRNQRRPPRAGIWADAMSPALSGPQRKVHHNVLQLIESVICTAKFAYPRLTNRRRVRIWLVDARQKKLVSSTPAMTRTVVLRRCSKPPQWRMPSSPKTADTRHHANWQTAADRSFDPEIESITRIYALLTNREAGAKPVPKAGHRTFSRNLQYGRNLTRTCRDDVEIMNNLVPAALLQPNIANEQRFGRFSTDIHERN